MNADDEDVDGTQHEGGEERDEAKGLNESTVKASRRSYDRVNSKVEPRLKSKRVAEDSQKVNEVTLGNMDDKDRKDVQDSVPSSFYDQQAPQIDNEMLMHLDGAAARSAMSASKRDNSSLGYYGQSISVSMN